MQVKENFSLQVNTKFSRSFAKKKKFAFLDRHVIDTAIDKEVEFGSSGKRIRCITHLSKISRGKKYTPL